MRQLFAKMAATHGLHVVEQTPTGSRLPDGDLEIFANRLEQLRLCSLIAKLPG